MTHLFDFTLWLFFISIISNCQANELDDKFVYRPVVFWHGMGDTSKGSLVSLQRLIEQKLNNSVYTMSIQIGRDQERDFLDSYFKDSNEQIEIACKAVLQDSHLDKGFTLIGFSQGGQFARALVQRCPLQDRPLALITIGAQHQGVFGLPMCKKPITSICEYSRRLLNDGAYTQFVQNHLVQAQYWHDPLNEQTYIQKSRFLSDINNEKSINETYKERLSALQRFVMVQFDGDNIVTPKESELFSFYETGQDKVILPLEKSDLYIQDKLGLRSLDERGKLIRLHLPGDHLELPHGWFTEQIINPFLYLPLD